MIQLFSCDFLNTAFLFIYFALREPLEPDSTCIGYSYTSAKIFLQ
jgi:hypothetical protein